MLRDAVEATRSTIDESRHSLNVELPAEDLALDADATRLSQAFMNLIHNAAKYMDKGGRIDVGVWRESDKVLVSFRDGGIGIAPDRLESIFEMFSQEETALSRSRGGLGIGLSLTRRLLDLHGGSISAHSGGPGQGSQFIVRLPLADALQDDEAKRQDTASALSPQQHFRILVADDDRDCVETLTALLEAMGHTVRAVFGGHEALCAVSEFDPQVVLLDIGMPGLNGYETCRAIRNLEGSSSMVISAVTGWGQPEDVRKAKEAGFDEHLVKPVDPDVLVALLSRAGLRSAATQKT